jgi:hypothetical protein
VGSHEIQQLPIAGVAAARALEFERQAVRPSVLDRLYEDPDVRAVGEFDA